MICMLRAINRKVRSSVLRFLEVCRVVVVDIIMPHTYTKVKGVIEYTAHPRRRRAA
jgi:hypothetical protein